MPDSRASGVWQRGGRAWEPVRSAMLVGASSHPSTIEDLLGPDLLARLDRLDVLSRKVFAGKLPGERRSKRRGRSVEFDDYRNYVAGDDLRHIDWNVFARLDRFFVKLFREDEDLSFHLVIDASPSMDAGEGEAAGLPWPTKLVFAQRLAMALAYIGLVNQNRVVLSTAGVRGKRPVQQLSPIRGRLNVTRAARFVLDSVVPVEGQAPVAAPASLGDALKLIAQTRSGKGVMVILSDFLVSEDLRSALNWLAGSGGGGGFDTYCLQVLSPGELEPEREAPHGLVGDLRLTDVETGRPAEVTLTGALIKRYKQRLADHCEGLRIACAARGMSHTVVRSDSDIGALLVGYLRSRGLLG
jgi:uncharacterized protein (DUF58 family)